MIFVRVSKPLVLQVEYYHTEGESRPNITLIGLAASVSICNKIQIGETVYMHVCVLMFYFLSVYLMKELRICSS